MSQGLIAVGAGIASFAGSVVFTAMARDLRMGLVTGLAVGAIGLAARRACLEEGKQLENRDWVLIGGASAVGILAGEAILAVIAIVEQCVFIGSMTGSIVGTVVGNMATFPLRMVCALSGRPFDPNHELPHYMR
jgi:hypothetical protein